MKKIILICAILIVSPEVLSWGKTGHRVVGEIAQRNLSREAQRRVQDLLGDEDLSRVSTWADEVRSNSAYNFASTWHYASIPEGKSYFDQKRSQDGDVIEALFRFEETLRDTKAPKEKKVEALKFLTHMMGDLHQPLHVGIAEDRGGNTVRIKWFKNETNLHSVWDENIVDFEQLSYTEYASYLNHFTTQEKKSYLTGSFVDWAKESQELRGTVYDVGTTGSIGYEYHYKIKSTMELRLRQAGIRLANLLNSIFKKENLSKDYILLRKKVKDNI